MSHARTRLLRVALVGLALGVVPASSRSARAYNDPTHHALWHESIDYLGLVFQRYFVEGQAQSCEDLPRINGRSDDPYHFCLSHPRSPEELRQIGWLAGMAYRYYLPYKDIQDVDGVMWPDLHSWTQPDGSAIHWLVFDAMDLTRWCPSGMRAGIHWALHFIANHKGISDAEVDSVSRASIEHYFDPRRSGESNHLYFELDAIRFWRWTVRLASVDVWLPNGRSKAGSYAAEARGKWYAGDPWGSMLYVARTMHFIQDSSTPHKADWPGGIVINLSNFGGLVDLFNAIPEIQRAAAYYRYSADVDARLGWFPSTVATATPLYQGTAGIEWVARDIVLGEAAWARDVLYRVDYLGSWDIDYVAGELVPWARYNGALFLYNHFVQLVYPSSPDADGDTWRVIAGDCNDSDPAVHPGASELCDGRDNDCDGQVDEDQPTHVGCYSLGWGHETMNRGLCHPGRFECRAGRQVCVGEQTPQAEVCDGQDNDCDGAVDNGFDQDHDSYAICGGDCDDGRGDVHPGAPEACGNGVDEDCDGHDLSCSALDQDHDGYCPGPTCADGSLPGDCDDARADVSPAHAEAPYNGRDDDCNPGTRDDDLDGDGVPRYGMPAQCAARSPLASVRCILDCDDGDAAVHPGAAEVCDGKDNDCDGTVDGVTRPCHATCGFGSQVCQAGAWGACAGPAPRDEDRDGHCRCPGAIVEIASPLTGVDSAPIACDDCNDRQPGVHPGAAELCNGRDDDCDGRVDEDFPLEGQSCTITRGACSRPGTWVCAPPDPLASDAPAGLACAPATEVVEQCNGVDDDCDGDIDEDFDLGQKCKAGLGACAVPGVTVCAPAELDVLGGVVCGPSSTVPTPGPTPEACNGIDDDCDGEVDEDVAGLGLACTELVEGCLELGTTACLPDGTLGCDPLPALAAPTAGAAGSLDADCDGRPDPAFDQDGDGVPAILGDTDDTNPAAHPGAVEVCGDGVDQDCDGVDPPCDDLDRDGDGVTAAQGDCNDEDPAVLPGAIEMPYDGRDDDCDPATRDDDVDGDGFARALDCDDQRADVHVGAAEQCDGVDNDCDGAVDEGCAAPGTDHAAGAAGGCRVAPGRGPAAGRLPGALAALALGLLIAMGLKARRRRPREPDKIASER